jgi:hypothetical protein
MTAGAFMRCYVRGTGARTQTGVATLSRDWPEISPQGAEGWRGSL